MAQFDDDFAQQVKCFEFPRLVDEVHDLCRALGTHLAVNSRELREGTHVYKKATLEYLDQMILVATELKRRLVV